MLSPKGLHGGNEGIRTQDSTIQSADFHPFAKQLSDMAITCAAEI